MAPGKFSGLSYAGLVFIPIHHDSNKTPMAAEMAQEVEVLAGKPNDLSESLGLAWKKEKNQTCQVVL